MHDVIIIGAGFSGLSAAVDLSSRGAHVLVLEGRPQLGGRATSYRDKVTGEWVDNGQHVLFGCYRDTFRFLRRLGVDSDVYLPTTLSVDCIGRDNRLVKFQCPYLPPPLHLFGGVLEWESLPTHERWATLRMLGPLLRARRQKHRDWRVKTVAANETVRQWLIRHGQGPQIREFLWEPLALAALNQQPDAAAAAPFVRVLAELCGTNVRDAAICVPRRPLKEFYADPAHRFIEDHGGTVRTKSPAKVSLVRKRLLGVETGGELIPTRAVIAAVPWHTFPRLFSNRPAALELAIASAEKTDGSPIATVNLWLDGLVLPRPLLGLPGRTMQWVFDKRTVFGASASHLSLVSSGATDVVSLSDRALISLATAELRSALPGRLWRVKHASVIRERQATFSLAPGQPQRPDTETPVSGLFLAGDWIETGLPATIESAVISGHRAADAAFEWLAQ